MQDKDTQEYSPEENAPKAFLSSTQEKALLVFACLLTVVPPFFYVWVWPNGYDHDFVEMRSLNAELKFAAFLLFASPLVGLFLVFIHFRRRVCVFDRPLLLCLGIGQFLNVFGETLNGDCRASNRALTLAIKCCLVNRCIG